MIHFDPNAKMSFSRNLDEDAAHCGSLDGPSPNAGMLSEVQYFMS
jgi:hypothetical protein